MPRPEVLVEYVLAALGAGGSVVGIKNAGLFMQRVAPSLRGMCLAFTGANPFPVNMI